MTHMAPSTAGIGLEVAMGTFHRALERELERLLAAGDDRALDPRWARAMQLASDYTLRPGKRARPLLLAVGWALGSGESLGQVPGSVLQFAAALELLHTFMLIHDDVADRAPTRRGGPSLQRLLSPGEPKLGDDLAVVVGDALYSMAIEAMLSSGAPRAREATQYMLNVCRQTAAGQYLDLEVARLPLAEVTLFQTLKVAMLKTAKYGFVAPLVLGAMLGNASEELLTVLERVGRPVGMAFQLRDDLIGLFGDDAVAGKDGGGDFFESKRTFPVIAAWTRASEAGRGRLESLWQVAPDRVLTPVDLAFARAELDVHGGRAATERAIERFLRTAKKNLQSVPVDGHRATARGVLDALLTRMARRAA